MQEIISAIDIGTTKICALTAGLTHDSLGNLALRILGEGQAPSRGIRRGAVVNVAEVTAAVGEAVEACEQAMGQHMTSAYVGIAGSHIQTLNSRGVSPVDRRAGVTGADMQRALEGARAVALPQNQEVIHTIARHWVVDGQVEAQQPVGMSAYRLEVDAHIVTGSSTAIQNVVQCITTHGVDVDDLVLEPLASNEAVLRPEERRMGVAVMDVGGGTTDVAVFRDDGLCHTFILDVGGNHLTNDLAEVLHTPFETAEMLKLRHGHVIPERVAEDEMVWATVFGERGERNFNRRFMSEVLACRAEEIFEQAKAQLTKAGFFAKIPAGIVLTGGASQLPGMAELGRNLLGTPVRVGAPGSHLPIAAMSRALQSPAFATSVGLLLWGMREDARSLHRRFRAEAGGPGGDASVWMGQTVKWLKNLLPG
ncbi:MAG: cell division protein FtsA [Caldilineaceae bacterium]|nr:cell division protein FtsA [Caldilineaceae bacterium]